MTENIVKNIIIKNLSDGTNYDERLEAIKAVLQQSSLAQDISLRIYRAEEDNNIIVEKWVFSSADTRKSFIEADGIALGPWPAANHDSDLGPLSLDSDNYWEE